jgi:uncharacterized membrane protein SpoIIM required for sporulation
VENMTGFAPVIWAVWGITVLIFIAIRLYASRMARDEESQIFLDEASSQEKAAQTAIVAKVHKIEPLQKASLWLLCIMTLGVLAYYILDIIHQFD